MKSFLKASTDYLGFTDAARRLYLRLSRFVLPIKLIVLRLVARSGWTSTLYYAFASSAFRREHQAVLAGRVRYYDEHQSGESAIYLLRRNVHRIEKGLIMRPRRSVFAANYIEETTDSYCQLADVGGDGALSDELVWAGDVLTTYFAATAEHPAINAARSRFASVERMRQTPLLSPYHRDLSKPASVSFKDLYALARRRRSVRWFEQRPVPRELIDKALEVAVQAPSACNRQPYQFRIFDEPERAQRIAAIPMGTTGFSHNIPAVAVLVGDQSAYFDERDRHVIYIDASLAAMSFLLALETLGLSSCCINWPDIASKEARIKQELGLRDDERVIMLIALGYPDQKGMVPYSQKKPIGHARSYNK